MHAVPTSSRARYRSYASTSALALLIPTVARTASKWHCLSAVCVCSGVAVSCDQTAVRAAQPESRAARIRVYRMAQPYAPVSLGPKPYNRRWQRFRLSFLASNPLCLMCKAEGRTTSATVVDHIVPHRGCSEAFWRQGNHQALCAHHHNSHKQQDERRGYSAAIGVDGWPSDPRHPALKPRD